MRFLLVLVLVFATVQANSAAGLSAADEAALVQTATRLRDAVVAKDMDGFLELVAESGLGCTDAEYSRDKVEADLRSPNGYLHRGLFDTSRFAAECEHAYTTTYPWISDRDFFLADAGVTIEVTSISENLAQVTFRSKVAGHYPREYEFRKEHGSWRLVYGVIVGGCSCG